MQLMKKKTTKILLSAAMVTLLVAASAMPAFAAGDVAGAIEQTWTQAQTQIKTVVKAGAIEQTWTQAQTQIKTVVNNVVFPVVDMILAILFFVKVGTAYFDYRKHGQFEFAAPCILFACLIFTLTAPMYIWSIL